MLRKESSVVSDDNEGIYRSDRLTNNICEQMVIRFFFADLSYIDELPGQRFFLAGNEVVCISLGHSLDICERVVASNHGSPAVCPEFNWCQVSHSSSMFLKMHLEASNHCQRHSSLLVSQVGKVWFTPARTFVKIKSRAFTQSQPPPVVC